MVRTRFSFMVVRGEWKRRADQTRARTELIERLLRLEPLRQMSWRQTRVAQSFFLPISLSDVFVTGRSCQSSQIGERILAKRKGNQGKGGRYCGESDDKCADARDNATVQGNSI